MPISTELLRAIVESVEAQAGPVVEAMKEAVRRMERVVLNSATRPDAACTLTIMDDYSWGTIAP